MKRGDVVRIDWPYSDRTGSKVRPAVVVQADALNMRLADTMLALVSRTSRAAGVTEVVVDPALEPSYGLRFVSVVSCNNILTVDRAFVMHTLGQLSPITMQKIDDCLRTAFGIP